MKPIVSLIEVTPICQACPSDWEAIDDEGREIYIRFRWGHLSVSLDDLTNEPVSLLSLQHSDPLDGVMSTEEMVELTKDVLDWVPYRLHYPSS